MQLPKLPGITERQYQPATSGPQEERALSAKGQPPAYNQYAKTCTQMHNGVHACAAKVICSTCAPTNMLFPSIIPEAVLLSCEDLGRGWEWRASKHKRGREYVCVASVSVSKKRGGKESLFSPPLCDSLENQLKVRKKETEKKAVVCRSSEVFRVFISSRFGEWGRKRRREGINYRRGRGGKGEMMKGWGWRQGL